MAGRNAQDGRFKDVRAVSGRVAADADLAAHPVDECGGMDSGLVGRVCTEAYRMSTLSVGPLRRFDGFWISGLDRFWFGERTVLLPLLVPLVPRHVRSVQQM